MANKMKKLLVSILATSTLMLASCDDVEAELLDEDKNSAIINVDGTITNNKLSEIYDALVSAGNSNSEKLLNKLLEIYSKSLFGEFYEMKEAVEDASKMSAFLAAHSGFSGNHREDDVLALYNRYLDSIKESFWNFVNNSSYQERSVFLEKKFYRAQINELYDLADVAAFQETELDAMKTKDDVEEYFTDFLVTYKDYIKRALLPDLYRTALTEQYLIEKNYGTLGRSYARKVSYIALPDLEKEAATQKLVRAYCELVLADANANEDYRDFRYLNALYNGYWDFTDAAWDTLAAEIYTKAGFTLNAVTGAYDETAYGKLLTDYSEISEDRNVKGTSHDFTNSNAYTKEVGLEIEKRQLKATSKVHEGWYTSSGLDGLPSSLKNRIFKMTVANEVDSKDVDQGNFGWYVEGNYYMVPEKYPSTEIYPYAIYDKDSGTSYLVRIDEAVKAPKLVIGDSETSAPQSYQYMVEGQNAAHTRDYYYQRDITLNVASLLSSTDSYKKAAKQHYVEEMALKFHDQAVYDYFEATFPDLFD